MCNYCLVHLQHLAEWSFVFQFFKQDEDNLFLHDGIYRWVPKSVNYTQTDCPIEINHGATYTSKESEFLG